MNDPHPDDEQLSTSLDEEPEPGLSTHVDGCPACRARLDSLASVVSAVAAVGPPAAPASRDRALDAARAAWEDERSARAGAPGPAPAVVALRDRRRPPAWLVGAAAALVAALAAVPLLTSGSADRSAQTAAGPSEADASRVAEDAAGGAAAPAAPDVLAEAAPVEGPPSSLGPGTTGPGGTSERAPSAVSPPPAFSAAPAPATARAAPRSAPPDLGDQAGPAELGQSLRAVLPGSGPQTLAAQAPGAAAPDAAASAPADGAPPVAVMPAPAPATEQGQNAPAGEQPACAEAGPVRNAPGTRVYAATLRYQGTPAVVVVHDQGAAPGRARYRAYVMATEGCRLLDGVDL